MYTCISDKKHKSKRKVSLDNSHLHLLCDALQQKREQIKRPILRYGQFGIVVKNNSSSVDFEIFDFLYTFYMFFITFI